MLFYCTDESFHTLVGLTKDNFYTLLCQLTIKTNHQMSHRSMLWLFLARLRQNLSFRILAWLFSCAASTVMRVFDSVMEAIIVIAKHRVRIPDYKTRYKNGKKIYEDYLTVVIDGSEQQVTISPFCDVERGTFSGKKNKHTFTILFAVAPTGKIYFVSSSYPGAKHDFNIVSLPENAFWTNLESFEAIGADKGYIGLDTLTKNPIILPVTGDDLTGKEEEFNNEFASIRTVVENVFAHIKQWKMCKHIFKINGELNEGLKKHNNIWRVSAFLVNEFTTIRPRSSP